MALIAMVKIYCLKDPRNNKVKYVGKTKTELFDRLKVHIHQSKKCIKPTHKEAWIKQLLFLDLRPIIELLEEVLEINWKEAEIEWIKKGKELGWKLTNLSIGGDGHNGVNISEENRLRLKGTVKNIIGFYRSGLGRKWTEEQKAKRRLKPAWNKGLIGIRQVSEETKRKMSESYKGHNRKGFKWSEEAKSNFVKAHKRSWETRRANKLNQI